MSSAWRELAEEYTSALQDYLAGAAEGTLQRAYELGRRALAQGLGVLDMATLHNKALERALLRARTRKESSQTVKAAENLFVESLSPFEMTHRGYREANAALRRLNEKLEEETKRIAHALHDEAGQLLVSVHIALEEVASALPVPDRQRIRAVKELLDQVEAQLRRLSHELRPTILDDLGLLPALEFVAKGASTRTRIPIIVEGSTAGRLPPVIETALYRIVQEALTNGTKHARATRMSVQLQQEDRMIRCSVQDDGIGFDVPAVRAGKGAKGLGLIGIQDRVDALGGRLEITSTPGKGATLVVEIPVGP